MRETDILKKQEEMLLFDRFTDDDAFNLGMAFARQIQKEGRDASLRICRMNGYTLFQCGLGNACMLNQLWVERKIETVRVFEKSSLRCYFEAQESGQTLRDHGLEESCAFAPGAFPIRVKGCGTVGIAALSGLPGFEDHDLLVSAFTEYLKVSGVPML